jgi:hypothetical protein
METLRVQFASK